jgi:UPF0176 protein
MKYQVLLFYKYANVEDPDALAKSVRLLAEKYKLTGRAIIASEGINATFEGVTANTEEFVKEFLMDERFADVSIKRSAGTGEAFPKLSVKARNEIVGTHFPQEEAYPQMRTAPRLKPEELRAMYENNEDFTVVDMRNDYEYASGHFKNSIDPGLQASRDLPEKMEVLEPWKKKKVITVCTGGIRCEKMSAYLLNNGFEDVYQLEDGIHGYMEKYPGKDFLGTLYTFDKRKVMDFGGDREIVGTCYLCEAKSEQYTDCANLSCHRHFIICDNCISSDGNAYCTEDCVQANKMPTA